MDDNDHRILAQRLELFHQQEEGPGMVFWHPRGFTLYRIVEDYIRRKMKAAGFQEIRTPQLLARKLWEDSGHWEKFGANMFALADGERVFALKPMSCPAHVQIFNKGQRSFRDLPLRYCEFGFCHRDEPSGALQGLLRTRAFVQDDAHIFCREDQIVAEVSGFCRLLQSIYRDFGFPPARVAFSTRPRERAGSDADWDRAEEKLSAAAKAAGLDFRTDPGEGAFYGPKLDFHLRDKRGREWQCGTVQLDLVLPARLQARYVDQAGAEQQPVMIHHAVLGSLERFIAMLLEQHQGALPLWLAPEQILVASLNDAQTPYASRVAAQLEALGYRMKLDGRSARLAKKVVDARRAGIPVFLTAGPREARDGTVSWRQADGQSRVLAVAELAATLQSEAFR